MTLSTLVNTALTPDPQFADGGADIVFRARRISTPEVENLLPSGYLSKSVSIDVGASASLYASNIYLVAQAEDRDIPTQIGLSTTAFLQQGLVRPHHVVPEQPGRAADQGAGEGREGDGHARRSLPGVGQCDDRDLRHRRHRRQRAGAERALSMGYAQAGATATIDVKSFALVQGGGAVNITSTAEATAAMSATTSRPEQGSVPGLAAQQDKGNTFAASLAVSNANVTSHTTVDQNATVHGGRTVNVRACWATSSPTPRPPPACSPTGPRRSRVGLQFSNADIVTTLSGTVTADQNTPGGEVVKLEFDPTVKAAVYTSDQTIPRLKPGDTVQLTQDMPATTRPANIPAGEWQGLLMPKGTVLVYVGPAVFDSNPTVDGNQPFDLGVNASSLGRGPNPQLVSNNINYRDKSLWQVTSEPLGYVDYANNRIAVFDPETGAINFVAVTEDTVEYSPSRGNSIGGLAPGTYVVIQLKDDPTTAVDESHYIQLAASERTAIAGP